MDPSTIKQDGRHARVERNKNRIAWALLAMIRETGEVPRAEALAERANVSRRSVFRLFDDRGALLQATTDLMLAEVQRRFRQPDLFGRTLQVRVARLVDYLAEVYEYITPVRRVSESRRAHQPLIREQQDRMHLLYRRRLETALQDALPDHEPKRRILLDTLQLISSWNAWVYLRYDCRRPVDQAKAVVVHGLESVLRSAAEHDSR